MKIEEATNDVLERNGVDIVHHFGGGVYAKETRIPAGRLLVAHKHPHDHLSILASGRVRVTVARLGSYEVTEHEGPECLTIAAGIPHAVEAVTDARWFCIHATDETDPEKVDKAVLHA